MRAAQILFCSLAIILLLPIITSAQQSYELFVSPTGDDSNTGAIDQPFASIERARDKIRELQPLDKPAIIYLREGTYELQKVFTLDNRDSGTLTTTIIYQSYPNEEVTISGGVK